MRGTKVEGEVTRDERRVARWQYDVGPIVLSDAAYDLLVRRLAIRWRATMWSVPIGALGLVPLALAVFDDPGRAGWARRSTPNYVAAVLLIVLMRLVQMELIYRWERRVSVTLRTRVARTTPVGVVVVLGRCRAACMGVTAGVQFVLGVAALLTHSRFGVFYSAVLLFLAAFSIADLRRVVSRPTIAVDEVSLAVDERLRSNDAFGSGAPLFMVPFLLPVSLMEGLSGHAWFGLLWIVGMFPTFVLREFGRRQPPWKAAVDLRWLPRSVPRAQP